MRYHQRVDWRTVLRSEAGASWRSGDWFGLTDTDTAFSQKTVPRPYVLLYDWSGWGSPRLLPRTRRPGGGVSHSPHSHRDDFPGCLITERGWIRAYRVHFVSPKVLDHSFRCSEPDAWALVRELRRANAAHEHRRRL